MQKSIYLSPSTQEKNIGAGNYGSEEYRANQIIDITEKVLKNHGIKVYRNKPTMSLTQVVEDSNSKNPDVHLAVHTNAFDEKTSGCEAFCHKFGGNGEKLARAVYNRIAKITPGADRGVKESYKIYNGKPMYEPCYTKAAAALIEVDFHDNPSTAAWIVENIELIGTEIAKGVLDFFGITFIPEEKVNNNLYRVIAGSFSNYQNAVSQVEKLKKMGIDSFIYKYSH